VFPLVATIAIMYWVWASVRRVKQKDVEIKLIEIEKLQITNEYKKLEEKKAKDARLIEKLERVVDSQDRIIELYREADRP